MSISDIDATDDNVKSIKSSGSKSTVNEIDLINDRLGDDRNIDSSSSSLLAMSQSGVKSPDSQIRKDRITSEVCDLKFVEKLVEIIDIL